MVKGNKVQKKSNKPFKSTLRVNTIKDFTINANSGKNAVIFEEDDSIVDIEQLVIFKESK